MMATAFPTIKASAPSDVVTILPLNANVIIPTITTANVPTQSFGLFNPADLMIAPGDHAVIHMRFKCRVHMNYVGRFFVAVKWQEMFMLTCRDLMPGDDSQEVEIIVKNKTGMAQAMEWGAFLGTLHFHRL